MSDNQQNPPSGGNDPYGSYGQGGYGQGGDQGQAGGYGAGGYGQGGHPGGYPGGPGGFGEDKPSNNLVWAILTTLFCCLPLGVVSIVYAAKVDGLWASGQYDAAREAAGKAKNWALISAGVAIALTVLYIVGIVAFSLSA